MLTLLECGYYMIIQYNILYYIIVTHTTLKHFVSKWNAILNLLVSISVYSLLIPFSSMTECPTKNYFQLWGVRRRNNPIPAAPLVLLHAQCIAHTLDPNTSY